MLTVAAALKQLLPHFKPGHGEMVALAAARGRVLAADVVATWQQPPFDNSAMDGHAFRYDTNHAAGTRLPVRGEIAAGEKNPSPLAQGCAVRIFTGAPLPEQADTVIMQENVRVVGEEIELLQAPRGPGDHVRHGGSDIAAGERLLTAGTELAPGAIAALAAQGMASVSVYRRPRVAIVSTGDELVDIGRAGVPGTIVNSNAYALAAQVEEAGGVAEMLPIAGDDLQIIQNTLRMALRSDVVVCSGGVSVGEYDLMGRAFDAVGIETKLWKVAIKPGKPLRFGVCKDTPVVGLPGNPVSALVTFEVFVRPGLRRMAGHRRVYRPTLRAVLDHNHSRSRGRVEFARARLLPDSPMPRLQLHAQQGSASLSSIACVDALAIIPSDVSDLHVGDSLQALLLNPDALCSHSEPPFVEP